MDKVLDPFSWYTNRELSFTPLHFTQTKTPLTIESKLWILNTLRGRFSVCQPSDTEYVEFELIMSEGVPAFEDPKEATMYELKWS
jgi:hypothetical protein